MSNKNQWHSEKRQFRRECERAGLVKKSGRQWKKFRKGLKATVGQSSTEVISDMTSLGSVSMSDLLESPPITGPLDDPTIV